MKVRRIGQQAHSAVAQGPRGDACGGFRSSQPGTMEPSCSRPFARILVAEWLQTELRAEGGAGGIPANQWWAHVDSNHGPLPYQAGYLACPSRHNETQVVVRNHNKCDHLQRDLGSHFPRRPNEADRGPGIWVAEWLQRRWHAGRPGHVGVTPPTRSWRQRAVAKPPASTLRPSHQGRIRRFGRFGLVSRERRR
jgi:hypothetical protein